MKSIQLTEKHKSKLLEMCRALFPNYPNLEVRNSMEDFCMKQDDCFIELQESGSNSRKDTIIHWFEFCITEIVNELAWRNIETEILADCEYENFRMKLITKIFKDKLVGNNFHIIDYLYKQFKKLK